MEQVNNNGFLAQDDGIKRFNPIRDDQSASGCFGRKLVVRCLLVTKNKALGIVLGPFLKLLIKATCLHRSSSSLADVAAECLTTTHVVVLAATGLQVRVEYDRRAEGLPIVLSSAPALIYY